jgi:hypothetical protein
MEVSGQLHDPAPLHPRERAPGTYYIGGWVGPRAVLHAVVKRKIPNSRWESNPRTSIVQPIALSLYWLSYNGSETVHTQSLRLLMLHVITKWRFDTWLASVYWIRGSLVSIVTGLRAERSSFNSHQGRGSDFFFATTSGSALMPTKLSVQGVSGLSPWLRRPELEANYLPPSSAEVKNAWSHISTPYYVFMAWC